MTNWHGNGGSWGGDAPVFSIDRDHERGDASWPYPDVWVTMQRWEPGPDRTGRDCVAYYTPAGDPEGWEALDYGGGYYDEGMSCGLEGDEHERRVLCFQAAELLYLHASAKGNPYADLCLGYVYSYDRCEGRYWDAAGGGDGTTPFDREARAYASYRRAAEAGIAEACYKLGDLLRDGRGCEADLGEAFSWYRKAYDLGRKERPVVWGSAALRLGRAFEEGEGCGQSFEEARRWYERATAGLGIAVRGGAGWYAGALRQAERGLTRVRQELSGEY